MAVAIDDWALDWLLGWLIDWSDLVFLLLLGWSEIEFAFYIFDNFLFIFLII